MRQNSTQMEIRIAIGSALWNFNKGNDYDTYVPATLLPNLERCLMAQSRIGWTGFLEGFLSSLWAEQQDQYFRTLDNRRSGHRWAVELSKQLWKLVFSMWEHRNESLFTTTKIDKLSGIQLVKRAIQQERSWGVQNLDPAYRPYFSLPLNSFSKMKSIDLRRWLCLIWQAREDSGKIYNDEMASDSALREWVGLDRTPQGSQHRQQGRCTKLRFSWTGYLE